MSTVLRMARFDSGRLVPADVWLRKLITDAMAESSEISSVVIGDHQGLPIAGVVRGSVPVMTVTAMATMAAHSAEEAAAELDLDRPTQMVVETSRGDLVMIPLREWNAYLIALVSPMSSGTPTEDVLNRLASAVSEALANI